MARFEIEKLPAFQFVPDRRQKGIVRRVMRHGQNATVPMSVIRHGTRPVFAMQEDFEALWSDNGRIDRFSLRIQDRQVFIRHVQETSSGVHLDRKAVTQGARLNGAGLVFLV